MYVIKFIPEDFVVRETSLIVAKETGRFTYFELIKKNWNTYAALKKIAGKLGVGVKDFGYAGKKDKKAITSQICSVRKRIKKDFVLDDIVVKVLGYGDDPVHLGDLKGNFFEVVIRNIDFLPVIKREFVNFFGEQRFGKDNVEVGRTIIKRDFKRVAEILGLDLCNPVSELRKIPRKELVFFVHAYQSFLWNKCAECAVGSGLKFLPIVGFGTEKIDGFTKKILQDEGIVLRDFVVKELPESSSEGSIRKLFEKVSALKIGFLEDDEFFAGKKKVVLSFFLSKGCYATEFIRQSFHQ